MTYIDYLNNFNRWLESNTLPGNSRLLYYSLLDLFNRVGWPKHVQVDNLRIMLMSDVRSEKSAIAARNALVEAGLIVYQRGKKGTPGRYILSEIHCFKYSEYDSESDSESDSENASHNKTKTKTKNIKENVKRKVAARFSPPTHEMIRSYCLEEGIVVDIDYFIDYYASNDWHVGKQKMKDWKAAIRNWARRDSQFKNPANTQAIPDYLHYQDEDYYNNLPNDYTLEDLMDDISKSQKG